LQVEREKRMTEGLEARVAHLEGMVDQHTERLNNIENWLRVLVALQVTTLLAVITATAIIVNLLT